MLVHVAPPWQKTWSNWDNETMNGIETNRRYTLVYA